MINESLLKTRRVCYPSMMTRTRQDGTFAAFAHRDFSLFIGARFLFICCEQMLAVVLGQHVYRLTHDPAYLGYIGLALFLPRFLLSLPAGATCDRFAKRTVIIAARLLACVALLALCQALSTGASPIPWIYSVLTLLGIANAFDGPANHAIVPELVPEKDFNNAVTWVSFGIHMAFVGGPAVAGLLYALTDGPLAGLGVATLLVALSVGLIAFIRPSLQAARPRSARMNWSETTAGLRYVFRTPLLLGIISLDLFAVLFGGAVALMPVFANDILHTGPAGLGLLRSAPSLGAVIMAVALARLGPLKHAGKTLLVCVALFGAGTVAFGLSRNFLLSLVLLAVIGAMDMVSVVIRGVLVQIKTPPAMRGRVSAVNLVFIGASNELGEFESGITASWFGTVPAVIIGGVGTMIVVAWWAVVFPQIASVKRLTKHVVGEVESGVEMG